MLMVDDVSGKLNGPGDCDNDVRSVSFRETLLAKCKCSASDDCFWVKLMHIALAHLPTCIPHTSFLKHLAARARLELTARLRFCIT